MAIQTARPSKYLIETIIQKNQIQTKHYNYNYIYKGRVPLNRSGVSPFLLFFFKFNSFNTYIINKITPIYDNYIKEVHHVVYDVSPFLFFCLNLIHSLIF